MRKWRSLFCILCLAAAALSLPWLWRALPLRRQPLIEKKYGGWSGVLRLWIHEGWQVGAGSVSSWLNRCIKQYEKAHPGVYVQPEYVDADAIARLGVSGVPLPDMLLLPPGLLASPGLLLPLPQQWPVRESLHGCGCLGGECLAVPVLAGGYCWAFNAAMLDGIPNTWRGTGLPVSAPPDDGFHQWSAALLALCSARFYEDTAPADPSVPLGEMDLGLGGSSPAAEATPAPEEGDRSCALPEDFSFSGDAWQRFINGDCAAIPVTQREVWRLSRLSEQGRGVGWRLMRTGAGAFTDQLLFLAIVDGPESDSERQALCEAFLRHLLDDECQQALNRIGAFSVTDAGSGYGAGDALSEMEGALRSADLVAPRCLDGGWKRDTASIVRDFYGDRAAAPDVWRRLAARIAQ